MNYFIYENQFHNQLGMIMRCYFMFAFKVCCFAYSTAFFPDDSALYSQGFELKRRGELKLVKVFQAEVFSQFLEGSTLEECYTAVARVADRWLDMLDTQGEDLTDEELLEYISESTVMSKTVEEYDGRKSAAITTAKRLGEFLGDERLKDKAGTRRFHCSFGRVAIETEVNSTSTIVLFVTLDCFRRFEGFGEHPMFGVYHLLSEIDGTIIQLLMLLVRLVHGPQPDIFLSVRIR
jgi:hypothetical protein